MLFTEPDPELSDPDRDAGYDFLDFDARDRLDDAAAQDFRVLTTGLPARPGTLR